MSFGAADGACEAPADGRLAVLSEGSGREERLAPGRLAVPNAYGASESAAEGRLVVLASAPEEGRHD
jgi:hypothetical protein